MSPGAEQREGGTSPGVDGLRGGPSKGSPGDPWGHGLCFHAEEQVEIPQGTVRGCGFGACSRVWVLEVGEVAQPGLPSPLLEKQKGEVMGFFFSFLMKESLFALVEKPSPCPSKTLSAGWWGQPRGALQNPPWKVWDSITIFG